MDTLVICIDRDNDLGEKAKVITPVVGRGANITAAVSLATADPEDSDTNTIFGGIHILDELRSLGVDAEIVSFAGDKNVGTISDKKIADQLDEFLKRQEVKSAIFVSDGAEDESLLPIVQSRIKVDSVRRIIVMQSENLESTYYMIKNFLRDPKFLQTFFVPLGLALIIYALAMAAGYPSLAIIGTLFIVGLYMILRAYGMDDHVSVFFNDLKEAFHERHLSFITMIAAILTFVVGTVIGSLSVWDAGNLESINYYGFIPMLSLFIKRAVLWYAASVFLWILGKIFDRIGAKKDYSDLVTEMLFTLSGTLLFWSASSYVLSVSIPELNYNFPIEYFVYSVVLAIIIAMAGIYFSFDSKISKGKKEKEDEAAQKPATFKQKTEEKVVKIQMDSSESDDADEKEDEDETGPVPINVGLRG
ncbi:DUF373 family protein [Methanolapillus millepedarum]|uniref:DUF373 family protein n=1 Tax=Methanolapillus millepedarum TaxID=3028296 RepID=A0AA96ZTU2_9EURY|nr:hypothetical protein MsAc7_05120 [Methanosarcinaceae archaeon Ac7]